MKVNKLKNILFMLLISVSFSFAQTSEIAAERHIKNKNFAKAREIYSVLANENPENKTFKFWIARLSAWMGEFKSALKIYDAELAINPNNNEALLGKAYILMWQKKHSKVKKILAIAAENDRYDAGYLIAKINSFRYQNRFKEARETLKIAQEVHPENGELSQIEKALENAKSTTSEVGCQQNFEPFTATTTVCYAKTKYQRGSDQISAKVSNGKRFDKFYREIGVSWQRELNDRTSINLSANIETQENPNLDFNFGINHFINERLKVGVDYRIWRLNKQTIKIFSTNIDYSINEKTRIQSTLYKSNDKTLLVRGNRQITKPLTIGVTYLQTFGSQKFATVTPSQKAFTLNANYQYSKNLTINSSIGTFRRTNNVPQTIYGFGFSLTK